MSAFEDALATALTASFEAGLDGWSFEGSRNELALRLAVHPALAPFVAEDRAAERPDALLVTREHLRVAFHEEYANGDFGCRHDNQHHASWDCWGHATDIFDALSGQSR